MGNITTAASKGDWSGVKRCVERGINIHTRDKSGWTALHLAARNGRRDICEYLISKGADVTIRNNLGSTALHLAARNGHRDTCEYLISKGA
eukprot:CAMPEP_0185018430 /NCGR_PEP_ID=MMETSP1103-20130426/1159_1 /TAXON_ID=36769 /ORGANISM="Paraphysomonas bandaiensis, Strain Caron Lab Isolate" /LENGTH=90 /DNA_ID=CAMNT_0027548241 /DNA_START=43 /DNA_END=311 /DNA_ORIENTATION=+